MTAPTTEILVIGHRNPDTDAICSAMAYADLHARLAGATTVACHLDELGPETIWLLRHLGLPSPRRLADVYLRVADVMLRDTPRLRPDDTVRRAGLLMHDHQLSALPVLDDEGRLLGMLPRTLLANRYLELLQLGERIRRPLRALVAALEAELVVGEPSAVLNGKIWLGTFSPEALRSLVRPGDLVIIEDAPELQLAALESAAGCLIVARNAPFAPGLPEAARAHGMVLLRTRVGSFSCAALIEQSESVAEAIERDPITVSPDDVLSEAQAHLREGNLACLPVVDAERHYLGLLLRRHLVPQGRRQVILTDHNHPGQAAAGVGESAVLAIVDHHNLGGLQTLQPLTMQIEPVGCTCTLIAEQYRAAELTPDPRLAGAMLGAILSDTVQFRSPTTTPRDRVAAEWLAQLSGESIEELARGLFRARLPDPPPSAAWWIGRDWKVFTFGTQKVGIAQVELVDVEASLPPAAELRRELAATVSSQGLLTAFLMLTDILEGGSVLLAANPAGEALGRAAFGKQFVNGRLVLPGVVSRKKQVVPPVAAAVVG
jgi:manganese-dependent inorganic pyrophosphatase